MELFFDYKRQERNGTEWPYFYSEWNGTGRDGRRTERFEKKEQEQNDLAEGPRSRTKQNDLKKVGMCPALLQSSLFANLLITIKVENWEYKFTNKIKML